MQTIGIHKDLSKVLGLAEEALKELDGCDKSGLPVSDRDHLHRARLDLLLVTTRLEEVVANVRSHSESRADARTRYREKIVSKD